MAYERIDWKDYPDISTPVSAENLNHMEDGIVEVAADVNVVKSKMEGMFRVDGNTLYITTE